MITIPLSHSLSVSCFTREAGHYGRDSPRRRRLARIDHNEEFHEIVVDFAAARLDNEDILVPHRLANSDACLLVRVL